jgi:60 kDa SS-A/Ro ribonucleoprotein
MANQSLKQYGSRVPTPQTAPIPGKTMVENSAGGFVFGVDDWSRLHRFLILGSDGGSYYASERELTFENLDVVQAAIAADGPRVVSILTEISVEGRAPKNDQAIFVLAMCAASSDLETRAAAYKALPKVCRIGTHLFQFLTYTLQQRGWSRGLRTAVGEWYTGKEPDKLAYQLIKYRQRDGWTHADALRLSKPVGDDFSAATNALLRWTTKVGTHGGVTEAALAASDGLRWIFDNVPEQVIGFERAQGAKSPAEAAELIRRYNLPREALPTELLKSNEVWMAMLENGMPITALVRNLATMTKNGLLTSTSEATTKVIKTLSDEEAVAKSRIHPVAALIAMKTYAAGFSQRGDARWDPVARIVDALDDLFYSAFGNVQATGMRRLIALDVSGSMNRVISGIPGLTARQASSAMAMVSMKTGDPYEVVCFSSRGGGYWTQGTELRTLPLSPRQRLDDICRATDGLDFGRTDCSLPVLWAHEKGKDFDVFEVYTDNETYDGEIHVSQALAEYRAASRIHSAKMVVVGMISNGFSIADPNDPGMLDVVGFDTATPNLISAFAEGSF